MTCPAFSQSPGCSYKRLGQRVQRLIYSPHVQKVQVIDLAPEPADNTCDWERLIDELEGTPGIRVERLESGSYRVGWREYVDC